MPVIVAPRPRHGSRRVLGLPARNTSSLISTIGVPMSKRDTLTLMQAITSLRDHLADQIVGLKIDQHHHGDE